MSNYLETAQPGNPIVSVILPTYNRAVLLCSAIQSIFLQTFQSFEIIVVDDCGSDVGQWVRRLAESKRIILLRHSRNLGIAATRNTGIRAARGKYIAYLDDDDLFYPDHLETLVEEAEKTGNPVVYSNACQVAISEIGGETISERSVVFLGNFGFQDLLVRNQIPLLCVLHQRACVNKVGGFDETLGTHEDWDMWIRLFYHFPYSHVRKVTCEYRVQTCLGGSITTSKRADFYRTMKIIHGRYQEWLLPGSRTWFAQKLQQSILALELCRFGKIVDHLRFAVVSMGNSIKKLYS